MTKKQFDAEQKAEELLMALGYELGESRAAFGEALLDENQPDPPIFMTEEEWNAGRPKPVEWQPRQVRRRSGKVRRALILAAVLILVMGLAVAASEGVKLKKNTVHMEETPAESTRIVDNSKKMYELEDFQIDYVPEGYELVEDHVSGDFSRRIVYVDENEKELSFYIVKTENYGTNVDNESAGREEVLINDKQAYTFSDGDVTFLVWQMGDCTVDITGSLSAEELVRVAEHIFVK